MAQKESTKQTYSHLRIQEPEIRKKVKITLDLPLLSQIKNQLPDTRPLQQASFKRLQDALQMAGKMQYDLLIRNISTLHNDIRTLCQLGRSHELFDIVKIGITQIIDEGFAHLVNEQEKKQNKDLIKLVQSFWKQHCVRSLRLSEVFQYLENHMIIDFNRHQRLNNEYKMEIDQANSKLTEDSFKIWNIGLQAFSAHFSQSPRGQKIIGQLVDEMIFSLTQNRQMFLDKQTTERANFIPIMDIIKMLIQLDLYQQQFEVKYIEKTQHFFRLQSNQLINKLEIPIYLHKIYDIIENESLIVKLYLNERTLDLTLNTLEQVLIKDHIQQILEKGFAQLVHSSNFETLTLLYNFLLETKLLTNLKTQWVLFIRQEGQALLQSIKFDEKSSTIVAVKKIFELKELTDKILAECFQNKDDFRYAQREGFESFLNVDNSPEQSSNYLAIFIDKLMQKDNVSSKNKQLRRDIKRVKHETIINVFRYLHSKDTFEAFFTKYLSERLIKRKSESWDEEKEFISKLKNECGNLFTQRVEQMFVDIQNSGNLTKEFLDMKKNKDLPLGMEFFVLSSNSWPISKAQNSFILPKQISDITQNYLEYYKNLFKGRTLNWSIDYCSSLVKGNFENGKASYQFEASGVQSLILLAFNNQSKVTMNDIMKQTNIVEDYLKSGFQALASSEIKLLIKESGNPDSMIVGKDDIYALNEQFTSKLKRLNINKAIKSDKNIKEEQKETEDRVKEDRRFQVDAAATKIMKEFKQLPHNDLIKCLYERLNFPIDTAYIKTRIESLIDKDYLKRNVQDSSIYEYVA
ncbi:cullin-4b isoform 2 [Stylonychia lemnae]|uniref:Cullin-4b isoform 2 n=1 Tax=Stylonychia lemnae TaxID=5949 RepID=A0A077ZU47_STYLE|nr:cullin-4b isoform 2 [Stylonychia lemnae]|eukprot:CDW72810.1 cullin-4b isoform 2 [Stylonychia lemnae]